MNVKFVILFSLMSAIPALFFHGQSILLSVLASRTVFFWLLYIILHKLEPTTAKLEQILTWFGIIWCSIMILQQLTYPNIYFNELLLQTNNEIQLDLSRGGLLRIFVAGEIFGIFLVFYSWRKVQTQINKKYLILFLLGLLGIFLTGSRQIIFTILAILAVDTFFSTRLRSLQSNSYLLVIIAASCGIYFFAIDYLIKLIDLSFKQNVSSKDYIRSLEIKFFLFDYWPNWISYFLGNGWEHTSSSYGKSVEMIKQRNGYYRSDVGLIGAFNKFGLLYCINIVSLFFRTIVPRSKLSIPGYIRLIFIYCLITSFSGPNYFERTAVFVGLILFLYIIDQANEKNINYNTNIQSTGSYKAWTKIS